MKGGYAHYMQKEIHEQPESILQTMRGRVKFSRAVPQARAAGPPRPARRQAPWRRDGHVLPRRRSALPAPCSAPATRRRCKSARRRHAGGAAPARPAEAARARAGGRGVGPVHRAAHQAGRPAGVHPDHPARPAAHVCGVRHVLPRMPGLPADHGGDRRDAGAPSAPHLNPVMPDCRAAYLRTPLARGRAAPREAPGLRGTRGSPPVCCSAAAPGLLAPALAAGRCAGGRARARGRGSTRGAEVLRAARRCRWSWRRTCWTGAPRSSATTCASSSASRARRRTRCTCAPGAPQLLEGKLGTCCGAAERRARAWLPRPERTLRNAAAPSAGDRSCSGLHSACQAGCRHVRPYPNPDSTRRRRCSTPRTRARCASA